MAAADATTSESRWNIIRDWIQVVVVVFAALSGAWQFVWKDIIVPGREPTALELTTRLEHVGEHGIRGKLGGVRAAAGASATSARVAMSIRFHKPSFGPTMRR